MFPHGRMLEQKRAQTAYKIALTFIERPKARATLFQFLASCSSSLDQSAPLPYDHLTKKVTFPGSIGPIVKAIVAGRDGGERECR